MLSRALSLATVMLLIGCFAAAPAQAQAQNLEAGKSPSQIFAGTCTACHKSPRGLLKTVPAGIAAGFPAPALHHQPRHGLAAQHLSDLQWRGRYALWRRPAQAGQGCRNGSQGPAASPSSSTDRVAGSRAARGCRAAAEPASRMPIDFPRRPSRDTGAATPSGWSGPGRVPTPRSPRKPRLRPSKRTSTAAMAARRRPGKRGRPGKPVSDAEPGMGAAKPEAGKSDGRQADEPNPRSAKYQAARPTRPRPIGQGRVREDRAGKEEKPAADPPRKRAANPTAAKPSGEAKSETAKIERAKGDRQQRHPGTAAPIRFPPSRPAPARLPRPRPRRLPSANPPAASQRRRQRLSGCGTRARRRLGTRPRQRSPRRRAPPAPPISR